MLLLLPPEMKKSATLEFGVSRISMLSELRTKLLGRMHEPTLVVVKTTAGRWERSIG